ncbi:ecdysteroid 22-kinase family protein [Novosphingobium album (ex Hu et al. 2023)]|uniref:Ecdysteroid 22-kinase family protein n=1 Tax=Novosphingobium album (ex Hu et al. 2023) TaxID=2930093 RepID=A0ABT0B0D3_9SPHN|nr:ecdysteroid 22-kinase family protein [Novosphingobium album (ex Hu et al. 2023)]MCJ2178475.1 ecdysteroid 22-kinase family protein [Novosphingobium album (ex Hu et al. 2023)]
MANARPLPVEIGDITEAWLSSALGCTVSSVRIADVNNGTCTKIRLALVTDNPAVPVTLILKGGFEPHSRMMDYMHANEVHAYADVAPMSPLRQPRCFFAGFDAERQQGIVIMEDLVARGVTFLHPQQPRSPEEVAQRLERLAKHHAMTLGRPGDFAPQGRFDWAGDMIDGFYRYGETILTPPVWHGFVESARGAAASVRFHGLDWFLDTLGKLSRFGKTVPRALLHGDTHLGNLYIDTDGEPGFFDSQPHLGPVMAEVAYHVTGALDMADRRANERELVAHYQAAMEAEGHTLPPLSELMQQYAAFLAFGYAIFLVNASDFQPEAINTAYTARFSCAMLDNDTLGMIAAL